MSGRLLPAAPHLLCFCVNRAENRSQVGFRVLRELKALAQPQIQGACCVCAFSPQTPVSWLEHMHQHAWGCVICFLEQGGLRQLKPRQPGWVRGPATLALFGGSCRCGMERAMLRSPHAAWQSWLWREEALKRWAEWVWGKAALLDLFCCRGAEAEGGDGSSLLCRRVSAEPGPASVPAHPAPPCGAQSWALGWGAGRGLQAGAAPRLSRGW